METDETDTIDIWTAIATERRRLADELAQLSDAEWTNPSQCEAWTVEEVVAHLVTPFEISMPRFLVTLARNRFDFDRAMIELVARVSASNTRDDLVAKLREHADDRWTPPRSGPEAPLTDIVVHGQDIRRPLGRGCPVPAATIDAVLRAIDDPTTRADYADRIGRPG